MLKTTHFIAFLPSSSANLSVISVISKKSRDAACCVKITHPSSIPLFVFICINMSWCACPLLPPVTQTIPLSKESKHSGYKRKCPDCRFSYRDETLSYTLNSPARRSISRSTQSGFSTIFNTLSASYPIYFK